MAFIVMAKAINLPMVSPKPPVCTLVSERHLVQLCLTTPWPVSACWLNSIVSRPKKMLHADVVPWARACHDSINDFAFELECAVLLIERKYTIGSCWSGSLVFCWFILISIWWQRKLRFMQVSVETWPSSTLQRDSTWLNLTSGRSGSCDFYVFGPLRSWTRMTRTSKLQVCCTQWDQNRSTSWNTSLMMTVRNLTKWL